MCQYRKLARTKFFPNIPVFTKPLELIYSNVCGPFCTPAYNGIHYFVTFVDNCCNCIHLHLLRLKTKSQMNSRSSRRRVRNKPIINNLLYRWIMNQPNSKEFVLLRASCTNTTNNSPLRAMDLWSIRIGLFLILLSIFPIRQLY